MDGEVFCKVCFKKNFFTKGNYSEGFGKLKPQEQHDLKTGKTTVPIAPGSFKGMKEASQKSPTVPRAADVVSPLASSSESQKSPVVPRAAAPSSTRSSQTRTPSSSSLSSSVESSSDLSSSQNEVPPVAQPTEAPAAAQPVEPPRAQPVVTPPVQPVVTPAAQPIAVDPPVMTEKRDQPTKEDPKKAAEERLRENKRKAEDDQRAKDEKARLFWENRKKELEQKKLSSSSLNASAEVDSKQDQDAR